MANEIPVGCVFVSESEGKVVARGRNRTNETRNVRERPKSFLFVGTCEE